MPSLDDVFQELASIADEFPSAEFSRQRELRQRRRELHTQAEVWDTAARRDAMSEELARLKARVEDLESDLIVTSGSRKKGIRGMLWGEWNWHDDAVALNDHIKQDRDEAGLVEKIAELERKLGLNR